MSLAESKVPRVLLTNDDGIDAPGLAVLEAVAAELADEVWVVAPEHDQSGTSHSISLHSPLRVTQQGERRFGVVGTLEQFGASRHRSASYYAVRQFGSENRWLGRRGRECINRSAARMLHR